MITSRGRARLAGAPQLLCVCALALTLQLPTAVARADSQETGSAAATLVNEGSPSRDVRVQSPDSRLRSVLDPAWVRAPASYSARQAEELRRAVQLEARGHGREAAAVYEDLADGVPGHPIAHWRAARALYTAAEHAPAEERDLRVELLDRSRAWAERGLAVQPRCAECMLFKAAALGRLATIHGVVWGAHHAREIAELLDHGIELEPDSRDGPSNSTLANLYFARAVVYRTVPEWFWLRWVIGMRGDIDRALADIRLARALHPDRLDYHVEHGVILLCHSQRRDRPEHARLGVEVLQAAERAEPLVTTDHKDQRMVRALLEDTSRACEFSRDGFMEIEEHEDRGFR